MNLTNSNNLNELVKVFARELCGRDICHPCRRTGGKCVQHIQAGCSSPRSKFGLGVGATKHHHQCDCARLVSNTSGQPGHRSLWRLENSRYSKSHGSAWGSRRHRRRGHLLVLKGRILCQWPRYYIGWRKETGVQKLEFRGGWVQG